MLFKTDFWSTCSSCSKTQGSYKIHVTNPKEQSTVTKEGSEDPCSELCHSTLPALRILWLRFPSCEKSPLQIISHFYFATTKKTMAAHKAPWQIILLPLATDKWLKQECPKSRTKYRRKKNSEEICEFLKIFRRHWNRTKNYTCW